MPTMSQMGDNSISFQSVILCVFLAFFACPLEAATPQYKGVLYFKHIFGHVHQNPSSYSASLTALSCQHPVKVYTGKGYVREGWEYVKVGAHWGYIRSDFLVKKTPQCFQSTYPKFFNKVELDIADLHYWGKLYDHYILGKSKVR